MFNNIVFVNKHKGGVKINFLKSRLNLSLKKELIEKKILFYLKTELMSYYAIKNYCNIEKLGYNIFYKWILAEKCNKILKAKKHKKYFNFNINMHNNWLVDETIYKEYFENKKIFYISYIIFVKRITRKLIYLFLKKTFIEKQVLSKWKNTYLYKKIFWKLVKNFYFNKIVMHSCFYKLKTLSMSDDTEIRDYLVDNYLKEFILFKKRTVRLSKKMEKIQLFLLISSIDIFFKEFFKNSK